ncbi:MAG: citrate transporter, partial [Clostridia bacterium]|nr:citrate transporter [Clostridia bacterium]
MCIAALAAVITAFIVPPDKEYLSYFDWKTLSCLFMTLAAVCALRNIRFFTIIARKTVALAGNLRLLAVILIVMTFVGSMIIANDMALITFLPVGYYALSVAGKEKHAAYVFILQNISANLGGMLTPFGNPQNLYLYSYFNIPTGQFMLTMLPPFIVAVSMLIAACFVLKPEPLEIGNDYPSSLSIPRTVIYLVLFAMSILSVFRVIKYYYICVVIIIAVLMIADRNALKSVDYPLLMTFAMFFIFSGNLSRCEAVKTFMSSLLEKNVLIVSAMSCQFISNVPSAILLSQFTENWRELLLGVNIGGTGTLIASLASLITFSEFRILYPEKVKKFILKREKQLICC